NDAPDVGVQIHGERRKEIAPDDDHNRAAEIKPDADSEDAGEKENPARHVLGLGAEADGEKFVNALNPIVVEGFDEGAGDHDTRQDRTDNELAVVVAPGFKAFSSSSQKSRCARFRRNDRAQQAPPRNRPAPEREILQIFISPPGPKAKRDN